MSYPMAMFTVDLNSLWVSGVTLFDFVPIDQWINSL